MVEAGQTPPIATRLVSREQLVQHLTPRVAKCCGTCLHGWQVSRQEETLAEDAFAELARRDPAGPTRPGARAWCPGPMTWPSLATKPGKLAQALSDASFPRTRAGIGGHAYYPQVWRSSVQGLSLSVACPGHCHSGEPPPDRNSMHAIRVIHATHAICHTRHTCHTCCTRRTHLTYRTSVHAAHRLHAIATYGQAGGWNEGHMCNTHTSSTYWCD